MRWTRTIRTLGYLSVLFLCAAVALGQHGPGGGGPGGGGPGGPGGGGGMNGPGGGGMGDRVSNGGAGNISSSSRRNGPQLGPPGLWWDDKRIAKVIRLRSDQQQRMDAIYTQNKGNLFNLYANLQREEQKLSSMSREDLQDETKVFAAIDRVTQARAEVEKENAHISLQLRKELDSTQLAALDKETAAQ